MKMESWGDVSLALAQLGRMQRNITVLQVAANAKIDAAKEEVRGQLEPLQEQVTVLEKEIERFARKHREDLGERKSKELLFGTVGFRATRKIRLPGNAVSMAEVLIRLKARGMDDCIKSVPDVVKKEALEQYPDTVIREVGATPMQTEKFYCEVNVDKL